MSKFKPFSVSIRVTWDEPAFPNGIIKEYIISYGTNKFYHPLKQIVTGNTMERVLDGLDKFTTYFIKVRGKTSKMGNASKILNATTFEDSKCWVATCGGIVLCSLSRIVSLFRCNNCYCCMYIFRLEENLSLVMGQN